MEDAAWQEGNCDYAILESREWFSKFKLRSLHHRQLFLLRILNSLIAIGYFVFCERRRKNCEKREERSDKGTSMSI